MTARKLKLTKETIAELEPPRAGETIIWDTKQKGFGVRLSHTGRRTYFLYARTKAGRQIHHKIGVHGEITVDQARKAAIREIGRIADGADPAQERTAARDTEEKRLSTPTMTQLCDMYLARHAKINKRPRSIAQDEALIERFVRPRLGKLLVPDVDPAALAKIRDDLSPTPYMANRLRALLSKMFSLAILWGHRDTNPAKGIERYPEEQRQRYLSLPELRRLAQALDDYPYQRSANAIRMLLFTGARRGEVLGMTWQQVERNPGFWVKPSAETKQRREHRIPLSQGARQLLEDMRRYRKPDEPYVFPGRGPNEHFLEIKKAWATICKTAGISGVRIHDLRHTYASILAGAGVGLPVIGALLGHTQAQTTKRYTHLDDAPLRDATERVDALLHSLAEEPTAAPSSRRAAHLLRGLR